MDQHLKMYNILWKWKTKQSTSVEAKTSKFYHIWFIFSENSLHILKARVLLKFSLFYFFYYFVVSHQGYRYVSCWYESQRTLTFHNFDFSSESSFWDTWRTFCRSCSRLKRSRNRTVILKTVELATIKYFSPVSVSASRTWVKQSHDEMKDCFM